MTFKEKRIILNKMGWKVESENPLEISRSDGSYAVGVAAIYAMETIITTYDDLEYIDKIINDLNN
jgi:hypothetical protein